MAFFQVMQDRIEFRRPEAARIGICENVIGKPVKNVILGPIWCSLVFQRLYHRWVKET